MAPDQSISLAESALPARVYGLVGRSLGHSFSPGYFGALFRRLGLDASYGRFEMTDLTGLRALTQQHPGLRGLNVTIPYKREVIAHLDALAPSAQATGAVNTIVIEPNNRWTGHNTDADGFAIALDELLDGEPCHDALVLGATGGAAAAVLYVLRTRAEQPSILSVARNPGRDHLAYHDLTPAHYAQHRLIVNCTPLGMHPDVDSAPPIAYTLLGHEHRLLDLVYNPAITRFMQLGQAQGARVLGGLPMLHAQADAAWALWQAAEQQRHAEP
jgi:shikimate dehydrogenase